MSKVDTLLESDYVVEIRAWTDPYKVGIASNRAFFKQIHIPTTAVRYEGMIAVDAIRKIEEMIINLHREICDAVDQYHSSREKVNKDA